MTSAEISVGAAAADSSKSMPKVAVKIRGSVKPTETKAELTARLAREDREHVYKLGRHKVLSIGAGVMVASIFLLSLIAQACVLFGWLTLTPEQAGNVQTTVVTITGAAVSFAVGSWSVMRPDQK